MMKKTWQLAPKAPQTFLNQFPELNRIVAQLLYNRSLTDQRAIDAFLAPEYSTDLYDPFLFKEIESAVEKILQTIEKEQKIVVYGDYDADGVTASAILVETLKELGANVEVYIPFRETEGYGLNEAAVQRIAQGGAKLIVTVDCGISNAAEVELARSLGLEVIVTDHHQVPPVLPQAHATINPNAPAEDYPFKGLSGCGVAFKLTQALMERQHNYQIQQLPEGFEKWQLDLVAIGTIADIQPLLGENRTLVKYGLLVLNKTRRDGLQSLFQMLGNRHPHIDERVIGWQVAPRLNAAGRLNHASTAYQLLITHDQTEAKKLSSELTSTNQARQQATDKIREAVKKIIGDPNKQKILIAIGDDWPTGIVGLVAGRLTDEFHRPSLVISRYGGQIVGSARSIPEFNIIEAIQQCAESLKKFGGHAQAAGFTIASQEQLGVFTKKMTALAEDALKGHVLAPTLAIEAEVDLKDINWEFFEELEKFRPFGEANPKPRFLANKLTVVEHQKLGKDETHMRLMVAHTTPVIRKTIGFFLADWCDTLKRGDKVDIIFEVDVNEWNGNRELQLKIIDLKSSI